MLNWLRAGYPEGIPARDYAAVPGVLRRKLTSQEIHTISADLAEQSRVDVPTSRDDIEKMMEETVLQRASDKEAARVTSRLAAGSWPLADPHEA